MAVNLALNVSVQTMYKTMSFYSLNMIDETLYTFIKVLIDIAFREFRFVHFSKLDKHLNSHTILLIEQMLKI